MDHLQFQAACSSVINHERPRDSIGTLSEKTMHAVLKRYFEPDLSLHEVKIGRYVADIARPDGIIEIQTRSFSALRNKLKAFLEVSPVTVVYPIPHVKWLSWIQPETGVMSPRRKSPKTGTFCDSFYELYRIAPLLTHPNLRLHLILLNVEEYRYLNGWSQDGKRGSSRCERIPLCLIDEIELCAGCYHKLLPDALPEPFTVKELAKAAHISPTAAQRGLYALSHANAVKRTGKRSNAYLYAKISPI